jgi:hypothetical protein
MPVFMAMINTKISPTWVGCTANGTLTVLLGKKLVELTFGQPILAFQVLGSNFIWV